MAKKKVAHREDEEPVEPHHPTAMDDASEKLESLKNLNAMLLKETVEKRQLVDSLQKAKGSLQSDLARTESQKLALSGELTHLGEVAARLELERTVSADFLWVQMGHQMKAVVEERDGLRRERDDVAERVKDLEREIALVVKEKSEIQKVLREEEIEFESLKQKLNDLNAQIATERSISNHANRERDELASKLDVQIVETNGLRKKLIEMEKLRVQYNALSKENEVKEKKFHSVMSDKEMIERSLVQSNRVIEELNGKIAVIVREKEGNDKERNIEMEKRCELEKEVNLLNEKVLSLNKVEEKLRASVAELENKCVEGTEKGKEMESKISELVEGKNESESRIASLVEEKGLIESKLVEANEKLDEKQQCVERMAIEKMEMEEAKIRGESEIVKLQNQMSELKDTISGLEDSCKVQEEKIMTLEGEVGNYKRSLESAVLERDAARKGLDEEKQNGLILKEKLREMENHVEEIALELTKTKADYNNIAGEKKELEIQCESFNKEILDLQTELAEGRKQIGAIQAELELANANSEKVLNLLKSTSALVGSKDERVNAELSEGQEMNPQPHVLELEAIKKGIKIREKKVEEMKREVEFLQNSVTEANKKKSLWTMISSATTIFAAISLAYVARGH
nr:intracellular protein transport protein USO1-like [Ipomoea batatas]